MPLDTTGLKPLDTAGLRPVAGGLDTAGLTPLDTRGLKPLGPPVAQRDPAEGDSVATRVGQNLVEFGKGIPGGAVSTLGTAVTGLGAGAVDGNRRALAAMDRIDAGEAVPEIEDPIGYQHMDAGQRRAVRAEIEATLSAPVAENPLVRTGRNITEAGRDVLPAEPGYEESIGRQLGEGIGSVAAGIGVGLMPGGQLLGPGMFAFAGSGEAVERALESGATEEQIIEAARQGIIPGLTDSLPVETLLGRIPVPGGNLVKVPANLLGQALRAVGRIGWQAFVEGVQEGGQTFLQNMIAQDVYAPDQELAEGVLPAAGVGSGVGAIAETARLALESFAGRRGGTGRADLPPPSPEDVASPLPTETVQEGRAIIEEALREQAAGTDTADLPAGAVPADTILGREEPVAETGPASDSVAPAVAQPPGGQDAAGQGAALDTSGLRPVEPPPQADPQADPEPRGGELFDLTDDWQEIPDGAVLPGGAQVRMDIQTGRQVARRAPDRPAGESFDPGAHFAAARRYVAEGRGPLTPQALGKRLGIEPGQAQQVLGMLASGTGSGIQVGRDGKLRRTPRATGPIDVVRFLAGRGGIRDDEGHDLRRGRGLQQLVPGGPLIRKNGMSIDEAGEALWEAGYFGPVETTPRPDTAQVLEMLDRSQSGKIYTPEEGVEVEAQRTAEAQADEESTRRDEIRALARDMGEALPESDVSAILAAMAEDGVDAETAVELHVERLAIRDADRAASEDQTDDYDIPFSDWDGSDQGDRDPGAGGPERAREPGDAGQRGALGTPAAQAGRAQGPESRPEFRESRVAEGQGRAPGAAPATPGKRYEPVSRRRPPATEQTDQGEQILAEGVAPVTDRSRMDVRGLKPMRGTKAQKPLDDGLFDIGARGQGDLLDMARQPEPPAARGRDEAGTAADPKPLYASRPLTNAADIIAWAREQGFKTTLPADEMHVTVAHSSDAVDWSATGATDAEVAVPAGERSVEQLGDQGAVVLRFSSLKLQRRWRQYGKAGASWDFDSYKPHITITYDAGNLDLSKVEPYAGPIVLGRERQEPLTDGGSDVEEVPTGAVEARPAAPEPNPSDEDTTLLKGFPEGYRFMAGKGPLGSGKWGVADASGHLVWKLHATKQEAARVARERLATIAANERETAAQEARERDIAKRLLAGDEPTKSDLAALGLKARAGFEWLSPAVQRVFGISRPKVREAMGDALKRSHTDSGREIWRGDAAKALKNAAAWVKARQTPDLTQSDDSGNAVAESAREPRSSEGTKPSSRIEDFGEKLEGARKDYAQAYRERLIAAGEIDIAAEPLSKSWPEPDYQKLLDEGVDPWAVAFVRAARDEIPTKPQKTWKVKEWVGQVETLRDLSNRLLAGEVMSDAVQAALREPQFYRLARYIAGRVDLYREVGHEKSLKGVTLRDARYSFYDGERFDPPKTLWTVERQARATAFGNMPHRIAVGDTREQALANFKKAAARVDLQPKADKQVRFSIYSKSRGAAGFFIGKKVGRGYIDLERFDTVAEARKHLQERYDDLVKALERWKDVPDHRKESDAPRVGVDHRNGADIAPERFAEVFGFRGVQFGNYVEGGRRQQDLNRAYDALMDLAGILDVPPRALSLNGELGLAFGARGKGGKRAARAHFEPDTVVINLTKREGAGTLAHEWWHALDNYFSRRRGDGGAYLSEKPLERGDGVRAEVVAAFADLVAAINQTGLKQRSGNLDKRRTKAYWSTGREMSARAFESYVIAKLADGGWSNDYLANVVGEEAFHLEGGYPYLTAAEIPAVRAGFDGLFRTIETRETDRGVEMFALGGPARPDLSGKGPVPIVAVSSKFSGADFAAERRRAQIWAKSNIRGSYENADTGWSIAVDAGGITKATSQVRGQRDLDLLQAVPDLLRLAVLVETEQPREPEQGVRAYHHLYGAARVGDRLYRIRLTVREQLNGRRFYDQHSVEIDGPGVRDAALQEDLSNGPLGPTGASINLGVLLDDVNYRDGSPVITLPQSDADTRPRGGRPVLPEMKSTETSEFRRWFGGSKAVDGQGRPLRLYHGTLAPIDEFSPGKRGQRTDARSAELGYFFASDPAVASSYASGYNAYRGVPLLRVVNKITGGLYERANEALGSLLGFSARESGENVVPVHLSLQNPLEVDMRGAEYTDSSFAEIIAEARESGRDGVILRNTVDPGFGDGGDGVTDVFVAFDPTQIKSVFNRGTWDATDRRISYAVSGLPSGAGRPLPPEMAALAADLRSRMVEAGIDDKVALRVVAGLDARLPSGERRSIEGVYSSTSKLITVSLESRNARWVLNHETVHALRDLGLFRPAEWRALEKAARADDERMADIRRRYYKLMLDEEALVEEAIADMFADWSTGQLQARGFVRAAFERIRDFLEALGNALRGLGWRSARDVFRAIEAGEVGRRAQPRDEDGKFASPDDQRFAAAWHGTPHDFDSFTTEAIGTGEGAQAYGWGLYFAGRREVADHYRRRLSGDEWVQSVAEDARDSLSEVEGEGGFSDGYTPLDRIGEEFGHRIEAEVAEGAGRRVTFDDGSTVLVSRDHTYSITFEPRARRGRILQVEIPDDGELLDWDKPLSDQPAPVRELVASLRKEDDIDQAAFEDLAEAIGVTPDWDVITGEDFYRVLQIGLERDMVPINGPGVLEALERGLPDKAASLFLRNESIPGLRYLDGLSRRRGEGSHNYVIFDEARIEVTEKFALADPGANDPTAAGGSEARRRATNEWLGSQPLDHAMRLPFHIFGGVNDRGEWNWGQHLSDQAARIITEARFADSSRFSWLNSTLERARAGLVDRYGLSPAYVERERQRGLEARRIMAEVPDVMRRIQEAGIGAEESKVLQAVLTGEAVADADMAKLAEPIRNTIDDMGAEAVQLGLISAEAFERNRGAYLHRVYLKHENDQGGLSRWVSRMAGRQRKKIIGEQFKGRGLWIEVDQGRLMRDVPGFAEARRGAPVKGETFRVLDRIEGEGQGTLRGIQPRSKRRVLDRVYLPADQAVPAKFAEYAERGIWEVRGTKGGNLVLWRDFTKAERLQMGEITDARYTIAKTYMGMAHDLATGRFYRDIADNADWSRSDQPPDGTWKDGAEYTRFWADPEIEWVKVPETVIPSSTTKRYAALAGRWARAEIWRDIQEIERMQKAGWWDTLLTQWKLNKTARSPVVHMNNVMSNLMLMDLADVRLLDLAQGIRAMVRQDQDYRDAVDHGTFGTDMVSVEIRKNTLEPLLKEIQREAMGGRDTIEARIGLIGKLADRLWSGARYVDRNMVSLYQLEDEVFRMATYLRKRSLGLEPDEAALQARDQFLNYDIRAPWVNLARRTVLPFISYTYRAVPVVARSVMLRPWKLAKYATVAYALNALGYMMFSGDEDEERRSLREEEQGSTWLGAPRMIRLPWGDDYGNPVFLDVRRWVPAGDVFDMNQGSSAIPVPAPLQFGGPLQLAFELALNKQAFTGDEIVNERTDDIWDRTAKIGDWAWKSWMPSAAWIPGSWYWNRIGNAMTGARDWQGRPYDVPSALASSVGIKAKPQDVEEAMFWKGREFEKVEQDLRAELRRAGRDFERGMISADTLNRRRDRIVGKLQRLGEDRQRTFEGNR